MIKRKIVRAAAYIRVSHEEQKLHGFSLAAQKEKLADYADAHEIKIIDFYIDAGVSGKLPVRKRPELQRMIADRDAYDIILFIKLDRFFRSVSEYYKCMELLEGKDWIATEEQYDTTTANGRFLITAKLAIAEMEADQTGERIRLTNEHKVRQGQPISGSQPFGYMISGDGKQKRVVKNPQQEKQMEDLLAHFRIHHSMRKTQIYMEKTYGKRLEGKTFKNLLTNPMLYGTYRNNPNYCPAYLTKAEWDEIQELVGHNLKHNTYRSFLFSGLMRCPVCGATLTGSASSPHGKEYKYYRCYKYRKYHSCDNSHTLDERLVENELLNRFEDFFKITKQKYDISENVINVNIEPLKKELERLTYAFTKGRIDADEYDKRYDDLSHQINDAQNLQNKHVVKDFSKIEELLNSDWRTVYNQLDMPHKKAFWHNLISEIKVAWTDDGFVVKDVIFK